MKEERKHPKVHLTEDKLRDLLRSVGVNVVAETETDLIGYCCFHHNVDSPAFNIEKRQPYRWKCWNGKCNQKGNIFSLLTKKGYSRNEARKMLLKGLADVDDLVELIKELLAEDGEDSNEWRDADPIRFALDDKEHGYPALEYAKSRGITEDAYDVFQMGYSYKKNMLVIPAFNEHDEMLGVIGRAIEKKQYQYSRNLSRGSTIWNANQVIKMHTDSIILTEGALDSVYIWQAGHRNVGAVLGSAISMRQWKLLRKYFTELVLFFDNDDAGKALTESIVKNVRDVSVRVVEYPSDVKDPGELTPEEINQMLRTTRSSLELLMESI
jgi:DNA primase